MQCAGARLVLLEAASGFGKTTVVDQLCTDRPALRVDLTEGDRSIGRVVARLIKVAADDPTLTAAAASAGAADEADRLAGVVAAVSRLVHDRSLLVVDDVHHLAPDAIQALVAALAPLLTQRTDVQVVIAGRVLPDIADVRTGSGDCIPTVRIGVADLAFDRDEIASLVGTERAALCRRLTDGWPAAVALWAAHGAGIDGRAPANVLDGLVHHLLAPLSPQQRVALRSLPQLDASVGDAIAWPTLVDDVRRLGIPVHHALGFLRVPDVVRERIADRAALPVDQLDAVARHYSAVGDVLAGIDLLVGAEYHERAGEVLGRALPEHLAQLDLHELRGVTDALPPSTPSLPAALLALARASGSRMMRTLRAELLDRLEGLVLDPAMRAAVEVERVWDIAQDARVDEAERRAFAVLPSLDGDPVARARCLWSIGQSLAMREDEASFDRAAAMFSQCAGVARAVGLTSLRAGALSALSYRIHLRRGQFDLAWARAEEALSIVPRGTTQYGALLSFAAEVLDLLARDEEALETLVEARSVGRSYADSRTVAYSAWNMAKVHARRGDAAAVAECLAEADAHHGDWFDHPTGAEFLAVAAELTARAGDVGSARGWLERARAHPAVQEYPDIVWAAEGAIALADGDATACEEILTRLLEEGYTEPVHRWQYRLWIAWARHLRGDDDGARELVAAVQRDVAGFGHPELPERFEPARWPALLALDGASHRGAAGTGDGEAPIAAASIRLLGEFAVEHGGEAVPIPPGKPEALVKLLAITGRPLPVEEVADTLWDDAATDVGLRRLRNVLSRVNTAAAVVVRDQSSLALAPGTVVDAVQFEAAAQLALRTTGPERTQRVLDALARYSGELLPGDRFVEHTVLPRERMRSLAVRLNETLADGLADRGDVDGAVAAIERLLEADQYDDRSADRAAALLAGAGRHASAKAWVERAERIRSELGAI